MAGNDRGVRFGSFAIDLRTEELHKHGKKLRLPRQSYQVLVLLLRRPGELVSREELSERLWPGNTFVDFDHGLNAAVNRLREVLGDSADEPRFIETLPRRGYRFIASVEDVSPVAVSGRSQNTPAAQASTVPIDKPAEAAPRMRNAGFGSRRARIIAVAVAGGLALLPVAWYLAAQGQRTAARTISSKIKSLAVLPLENLSGDPAQEYFADGMTDALITNLAKIGDLRVISRTSAMHYRGTRTRVPEIGRELNVDTVIEGTVLRSGDHVRITAQLIRTASDEHLWAEAFEGQVRDVITLQNQVARAIAAQVRPKFVKPQNPRAVNSEAYDYYLKGRDNFWERSREAMRYFEMAIEKDGQFAAPYAGLAQGYSVDYFLGKKLSPRDGWSKAAVAATKALELDDQLAEAHLAMANVRFRFDWNWPEAEGEFRRGLELSPNDAFGHTEYGIFLGVMGRFDEALREATEAVKLDPISPRTHTTMSWIYSWSRREDEAIAELRKTLELYPDFVPAYAELATNYEDKGLHAQAVTETLKSLALRGDPPEQVELLRKAFAAFGAKGFWEKRLELEKQRPTHNNYFILARLCLNLGRTDEAFDWLEKAYAARYPNMPNIKTAAVWLDPVRSDPRYTDLLRRVGLSPDH